MQTGSSGGKGYLCAEFIATIQNGACTLEYLPPGKRAIPLRWVFRIKRDAKRKFEKYKCRIVVKGYSQIAGLDFNETFAPVVRIESVRVWSDGQITELSMTHRETIAVNTSKQTPQSIRDAYPTL